MSGRVVVPLVFEQLVAVLSQRRICALGNYEIASRSASPSRSTAGTGQQHAQSQHCHRADNDSEEEQRPSRPGDVIAQHRKVFGQRVRSACVAEHTD